MFKRNLMKAAIARLNQARKNLAGFPCTPRSKFARASLRALAVTGMCFSMAFATVAVPAISDVTAVEAEAASGWAAKTMSCSVEGKAKKIVVTWDKLSGAKKYKVQRKEKGGSWKTLTTVSSSKTKYADSTAKSGKTYFYKVTAYNGKKWTKGTKSAAVSLTGSNSSSKVPTKESEYYKDFSEEDREWFIETYGYVSFAGYPATLDTAMQIAYTVAGALIPDNNCATYATNFWYFCREAGITCVSEYGAAGGGGHYWNRVTIGGTNYWFDVTWYDCTGNTSYLASGSRWSSHSYQGEF